MILLAAVLPLSARAGKVSFNRDVRPILSNNCFFCHGPDEKKREAKLRLDVRESALADHEGERAIVPGKPEESAVMERLLTHDKEEMMPPFKSKRPPVTTAQVETLRQWIAEGAEYEAHWAFLPIADAAPPEVRDAGWVKNGVDRFILARLEGEEITPSPAADAGTLCRRMYLDVTGLLPTPDEVATFTKAMSADRDAAVSALADRLLASPHYGERWGRHWLDQARYADSNGYTIDSARAMWPFRDWVIEALNEDMPFEKFTVEQLAGDLLPKPTKSDLIATAFHRNTTINEEGGSDKEQFRNEAVVDRTNTTATVWLGLTVGCAQCHSHKFDPISHREYYEMFAFFNSGTDVNNKGATIEVARGEVFGHPVAKKAEPRPADAGEIKAQQEWERAELARATTPQGEVKWSPAAYVEYDTATGAGFQLLPDNSLLADGRGAFNDTYRVVAKTELKQVAAVRLRVLTHESLPKNGPGTASNGNFVLTDFEASAGGEDRAFARAFADHEQATYPVSAAIDDKPKSGWAINVGKGEKAKMNADHEAVFIFEKAVPGGQPIEFKMHHDLNEKYLIGRFALEFSEMAPSGDGALVTALKVPPAKRSEAEARIVREAFERTKPQPAKETVDAKRDFAELMVMKETDEPRVTFVHLRGDFLRNDEKTGHLNPGGLSAVAPPLPAAAGRTRLDLAKWIVDPANPLTARVAVNRIWAKYFGRGIVETDEDFGAQGSAPTHPELLDWLAREFVRGGWSMKAMHRLIVTSAAYQQSSAARPDLAEKDPRNLLLARQERLRFDAEIVRDAALSASGLLAPEVGGPSVHPPQAEGVYAFTQDKKKWTADTGPDRFRRALYTTFYRAAPYPLFTTFDAPDFQTTCTRRARSDTPLQALTVANDPAFLELAQGLAARLLRESPAGTEAQLRRAFVLCLSREPSAKELQIFRDYFDRQAAMFAEDADSAAALLSPDLKGSGTPANAAAALVCAARALLNTDVFISRE